MSETTATPSSADILREVEAVLGRRIDEIERENRQLRRNGLLTMIGVAAILLISTVLLVTMYAREGKVHDVVEAHRFVLRDGDGHIRGFMGVHSDGSSRLILQDRDGRERLRLTLLPDGSPGVSFTDREGRSRAVLGLLPDETSTLVFADRTGKTRAVLGLSPDESSTLVFADRFGETRVGLGVDPQGQAGLTLFERVPETASAVDPTAAPRTEVITSEAASAADTDADGTAQQAARSRSLPRSGS